MKSESTRVQQLIELDQFKQVLAGYEKPLAEVGDSL